MMYMDAIKSITDLPAEDLNFKSALSRATGNQIRLALEFLRNRVGNNEDMDRIAACECELKRRERNVN